MQSFEWNDIYEGTVADEQPPDPQLLSIIQSMPRARALDVGCGAGGLAVALAALGWEVTGIDLAPRAIAAARAVAAKRGVQPTFQTANASTWQPNQTFDLIVSSFALPDDRAARAPAFAMMGRALAPGGIILIKDFDAAMARIPAFDPFELVTLDELGQAFKGLEVVRSEIVETPAHPEGSADGPWTAALFEARRPALARVEGRR